MDAKQYMAIVTKNKTGLLKALYDLAADIDAGDMDLADYQIVRNLSGGLSRLASEQQSLADWMERQITGNTVSQKFQ